MRLAVGRAQDDVRMVDRRRYDLCLFSDRLDLYLRTTITGDRGGNDAFRMELNGADTLIPQKGPG